MALVCALTVASIVLLYAVLARADEGSKLALFLVASSGLLACAGGGIVIGLALRYVLERWG